MELPEGRMNGPPLLDKVLPYTPYGKHVVVTGGSKGIGRSCVEEFAGLHCRVLTCARSEDDIDKLLQEAKANSWDVHGIVADVSTAEGRAILVEEAKKTFDGKLDVLINNVGTNIRKSATEFTDEDFALLFDTNLKSAFCLSRDFHPLLRHAPSGSGCVIMNSSVAGGPTAMFSGSLYAMTKASMNQLTKNLACEWAKDGIRVVSVAPWYTDTELANQVLQNNGYLDAVLARTPMKRIAKCSEVARVMAFLTSPAAAFMTGLTVPIDGGYSIMGLF